MVADTNITEDIRRLTQQRAVKVDLGIDRLIVDIQTSHLSQQGGEVYRQVVALGQDDRLLLTIVSLLAAFNQIGTGRQGTLPRCRASQLVVDVDLHATGRTIDIDGTHARLQRNGHILTAGTNLDDTLFGSIAVGIDAVAVLTIGQADAHGAVGDSLQLVVDEDGTVLRRNGHDEIAGAIVITARLQHGLADSQVVSGLALDTMNTVIGKGDMQRQVVGMFYTQLLRALGHVDPILACLVGNVTNDIALEDSTEGSQLNFHQRTRLLVEVFTFKLAGRDIITCHCH